MSPFNKKAPRLSQPDKPGFYWFEGEEKVFSFSREQRWDKIAEPMLFDPDQEGCERPILRLSHNLNYTLEEFRGTWILLKELE